MSVSAGAVLVILQSRYDYQSARTILSSAAAAADLNPKGPFDGAALGKLADGLLSAGHGGSGIADAVRKAGGDTSLALPPQTALVAPKKAPAKAPAKEAPAEEAPAEEAPAEEAPAEEAPAEEAPASPSTRTTKRSPRKPRAKASPKKS